MCVSVIVQHTKNMKDSLLLFVGNVLLILVILCVAMTRSKLNPNVQLIDTSMCETIESHSVFHQVISALGGFWLILVSLYVNMMCFVNGISGKTVSNVYSLVWPSCLYGCVVVMFHAYVTIETHAMFLLCQQLFYTCLIFLVLSYQVSKQRRFYFMFISIVLMCVSVVSVIVKFGQIYTIVLLGLMCFSLVAKICVKYNVVLCTIMIFVLVLLCEVIVVDFADICVPDVYAQPSLLLRIQEGMIVLLCWSWFNS